MKKQQSMFLIVLYLQQTPCSAVQPIPA